MTYLPRTRRPQHAAPSRSGADAAAMVSAVDQPAFAVDHSGRISAWNRAMAVVSGVATTEAVGRPLRDIFSHLDVVPELFDPTAISAEEAAVPVSFHLATSDGVHRVEATRVPLAGGGMAVIARDTSADDRLQARKDDFLATVSHELRTPLTPLRGFLLTLQSQDAELGPDGRARLHEVLVRQVDRLSRLVEEIMAAAGADEATERRPIEMVSLIESLIAEQQAAHGDADISFRGLADGAWARADVGQIRQVLRILCENALAYGGDRVEVELEQVGSELWVRVLDWGDGIPESLRDDLFSPFTRAGELLTRRGGLGLGLYIARRIVENMGGSISASEPHETPAWVVFSIPTIESAFEPTDDHTVDVTDRVVMKRDAPSSV